MLLTEIAPQAAFKQKKCESVCNVKWKGDQKYHLIKWYLFGAKRIIYSIEKFTKWQKGNCK